MLGWPAVDACVCMGVGRGLPPTRSVQWQWGVTRCLWRLQDGTITHEVKLTGEVSTTLASPEDGNNPRFGTLVRVSAFMCIVLMSNVAKATSVPSRWFE